MHTVVTGLSGHPAIDINVIGIKDERGRQAAGEALKILAKKLPTNTKKLVAGTIVHVGNGLTESGGQTYAEEKKIILDADKNALSLQAAEDFLVSLDILNKGDWTKALPETKDQDWSCLTYQLVHEVGHVIDGLSKGAAYKRLTTEFSPTKYGKTKPSEAFAEAFAYWIFNLNQHPEANHTILAAID